MGKWKTIVGVLLVLILGALAGSLGTEWFLKSRHPLFKQDPEQRVAFIMQRLSDRLDLTAVQQPAIETVVRRMDEELQRHLDQQRLEMRRILDSYASAIKPMLSPEQQEKFAAFKQELEARRKNRKHPPEP